MYERSLPHGNKSQGLKFKQKQGRREGFPWVPETPFQIQYTQQNLDFHEWQYMHMVSIFEA